MFKQINLRNLIMYVVIFSFAVTASFAQEITVNIDGYQTGTVLNVFEGQTFNLTISQTNDTDDSNNVTLICLNTTICQTRRINAQNGWAVEILTTGNNAIADTQIAARRGSEDRLISNGIDGKIPIRVYEVSSLLNIENLKVKEKRNLSELFKLDEDVISQNLKVEFDGVGSVKFDGTNFSGERVGRVTLTVKPNIGKFSTPKMFSFDILPADRQVKIIKQDKPFKDFVNEALTIRAEVVGEDGNRILGEADNIVWEVKNTEDKNKVYLQSSGDGEVTALLLEASDKPVFLTAKIKGTEIEDTVAVFIRGEQRIIGFDNLEMRLDLMDERTAKDLFGGVSVDDYLISKIRIFNKVPKESGGGPASSILFFSEALEVNVSLEKRLQEGKHNAWQPISLEDVEYINNWVYIADVDEKLFKFFIERKGECSEELQKILKNRQCQIGTAELDRLWYFYEKKNCLNGSAAREYTNNGLLTARPRCETVAAKNWIPFRPYAFLVVASTHDRRYERSRREKILRVAEGLVSAASFATTFARPGNNTGFVFGLDKSTNLLIPAYEKLFPSRREVQRKNILDMVLQPVEEIPFGKEVSKIVFIPKQEIEGVLPGYDVRIRTISVSKMKAEAAIVQKEKIEQR